MRRAAAGTGKAGTARTGKASGRDGGGHEGSCWASGDGEEGSNSRDSSCDGGFKPHALICGIGVFVV